MGTASSTKYIKQNLGGLIEEPALTTSAGAADANRVPALNASGVLDSTIINAKVTSAGVADAGKVVALDASGRLDVTVLPTGIGADVAVIQTSEALVAGDFVNIWNNAGARVRKSDASTAGKHAMGFVLTSFGSATDATVYFEGTNNAVSGQVPGDVFLSTTPGSATATPPSAAGNVVQPIGFAVSATAINFNAGRPIILA